METPEYLNGENHLLAKAVCQAKDLPLKNRFREAHSHRDLISTERA
jgi:hypothetical protein